MYGVVNDAEIIFNERGSKVSSIFLKFWRRVMHAYGNVFQICFYFWISYHLWSSFIANLVVNCCFCFRCEMYSQKFNFIANYLGEYFLNFHYISNMVILNRGLDLLPCKQPKMPQRQEKLWTASQWMVVTSR